MIVTRYDGAWPYRIERLTESLSGKGRQRPTWFNGARPPQEPRLHNVQMEREAQARTGEMNAAKVKTLNLKLPQNYTYDINSGLRILKTSCSTCADSARHCYWTLPLVDRNSGRRRARKVASRRKAPQFRRERPHAR